MSEENLQVRLASRPAGPPTAGNFTFTTEPLPVPREGQVLLRTRYLSLDPYMRGRMSDAPSYAPPVEVGGVMVGATIGEVVESKAPGLALGDVVLAYSGWQRYGVARADTVTKLDPASVQTLLRGVDKNVLGIALKGATEPTRAFFIGNMSSRAAKNLEDDMSAKGPVRLKECDEAQMKIVSMAKDLAAKGEIMISKNNAEDELIY